jgi:hypothetical protein
MGPDRKGSVTEDTWFSPRGCLSTALIWPSLRRIERDMDKKENIVLSGNSKDFGKG